jgi:hypothetical protein
MADNRRLHLVIVMRRRRAGEFMEHPSSHSSTLRSVPLRNLRCEKRGFSEIQLVQIQLLQIQLVKFSL